MQDQVVRSFLDEYVDKIVDALYQEDVRREEQFLAQQNQYQIPQMLPKRFIAQGIDYYSTEMISYMRKLFDAYGWDFKSSVDVFIITRVSTTRSPNAILDYAV